MFIFSVEASFIHIFPTEELVVMYLYGAKRAQSRKSSNDRRLAENGNIILL